MEEEIVLEDIDTSEPEQEPEENIDDIKAELAKAKEIAENQRIRAEKAEAKAKSEKPEAPVVTQPTPSVSLSDLVAISNAKVHQDDIERVERFAKNEGISITEALNNKELKAILSVRREERETAEATNVGTVRRGNSTVSDDSLLRDAEKGKLPDTDEGIARLINAKARQK